MIVEALRAPYDLAPACEACEEHRATREGYQPSIGLWRICDREACAAQGWSTAWRDLPHAAALRSANAAHEAGR